MEAGASLSASPNPGCSEMAAAETESDRRRVSSPLSDSCPCCGAAMHGFLEVPEVPVNSCVLIGTEAEARSYPRGHIVLAFCPKCAFIRNSAFDPVLAAHTAEYEETQGYSPTFQRFHRELAQDLIQRHDVHDKDIIEIGCGKGEFLALLCQLGPNRGIGFDPSYDPQRGALEGIPGARVIRDFYSDAYAAFQADLVCCKMTLEHVEDPAAFLRLARLALRPERSSVVYFQVPDTVRILEECAFQDIYYEHCSYFTAGSLARLFRTEGFEVCNLRTCYSGQYVGIEARIAPQGSDSKSLPGKEELDRVACLVESFPGRYAKQVEEWRRRITARGPIALWGSGSKAVAFLSAVDWEGIVDRVVDINPFRQGHFMPGSGQPIVAPERLKEDPPATVIVMNSVYREEITRDLRDLGLDPDVLVL